MSVQTLLLDFSLEPNRLGDESGQKSVFNKIESVLKEYIPNLILVTDIKIDGGSLKLLTGKRGSSISIRLFDRGLITINIEYYKEENEPPLIDFDSFRDAETKLHKYIEAEKAQAYPPIKRTLFSRYFPSSDERLLEYDIDGVVFDKRSPFQKVQIVHSKSLGNMLILDELQNISEADLIYTETLMQRGKECYEGAEIVILGGGDGGLLYELMKEKPKFVWMLEIDEMVMSACNKHMKSVCGDVLEERKAHNYEIIVDDCMVTLNKFISQGKKFDYVFGDLTDIPISNTPSGQIWDFIMTILEASFKILKPTGKFMTHGNGANSADSLKMYEAQLAKLAKPVTYTKTSAFVPSFLEDWIFYQISFQHSDNGSA